MLMECCQYDACVRYEIAEAADAGSKRVLVKHSSLWVILYTALCAAMVALCVYDWNANIVPILESDASICTNITYQFGVRLLIVLVVECRLSAISN